MKRILVTGGAGFIGSNFCHFLLGNTDSHVTVVDSLTYAANLASIPEASERFRFVRADITDSSSLDHLVSDCDLVVHFAAESHNDNSIRDPGAFIRANVLGTFEILEAVRRHGVRLHHISTDEVFGDLKLDDPSRFTEQTPYNPSSPYSSSKASSDLLVRAWVRTFGITATISNCSNNFGPRQHVEKFIPRQITNLIQGHKPRVYGAGKNVRDWIYVDDHSSAVWDIIQKGKSGETYLIGADGERSNLEVVKALLKIFELPNDYFEFVGDRAGHDLRYAIDSSKLRKEIGWQPDRATFEERLAQTVEWYRSNDSWWRPTKSVVERNYLEAGH